MEVRRISPRETYPLRFKVLWPHKHKEEWCSMEGDDAPEAFHLGVFTEDNKLISVGSFLQDVHPEFSGDNQFRLRAMATDPDYSGKGSGSLLLNEAFVILNQKHVQMLWCDARLKAVPFYEKLGFIRIGETYEKPNIGPHYLMYREI
jgi:predicted GNAT family N-acyltransferase